MCAHLICGHTQTHTHIDNKYQDTMQAHEVEVLGTSYDFDFTPFAFHRTSFCFFAFI